MNIYGYEDGGEKCFKLKEATIMCTKSEIELLIKFLQTTKEQFDTINENEYNGYCHNHYRDWNKEWSKESSDLIILTDFSKLDN